MLKPKMNISELSITFRINPRSPAFSSSIPAPEISDTYPGTSGNTQGDRNDTSPATKAAIGDTDDIRFIVTFEVETAYPGILGRLLLPFEKMRLGPERYR